MYLNIRKLLVFSFLALAASTSGFSSAFGESFSWTDSSGRKIYGSKPPKDARNVERLNTKPLSRYSSTKMLARLGTATQNALNEKAAKTRKSKSKEVPSLLLHDDIELKQDDAGQIISCRVVVQNPSTETYREVNVAFEFIDGTLVPAIGPEVVAAQSSAQYTLPQELLPMKLQIDSSDLDPNKPLVSRVMIHGTAG